MKYDWSEKTLNDLREVYVSCDNREQLTAALTRLSSRTGIPRGYLSQRAGQMGLSMYKQADWSHEDIMYLINHAGTMPIFELCRRLKRSYASVTHKINRMGHSARTHNGYTIAEIMQCFGVSNEKVHRWTDLGFLVKGTRGGYTHDNFSEKAVRQFVLSHPDQYDLRRVDQLWFKTLIASGWDPTADAILIQKYEQAKRKPAGKEVEEAHFHQLLHVKMQGVMAQIGAD